MKQAIILILFLAICLAAGAVGSLFTAPAIPQWYAVLDKPSFNPPNWLFAPVWTALYFLMGVAMYLVYKSNQEPAKFALWFFGAHLVVNIGWSFVFFGLKNPGLAFAAILLLWLMIAYSIYLFSKVSKTAAWLLLPYILWVSFASVLNYAIWTLNS